MVDFADIKGHECAKRGLEVAAAGGHSVLLIGPPGAGKTMLARAFSPLLGDPDGHTQWRLSDTSKTRCNQLAGACDCHLVIDAMPEFKRRDLERMREYMEGGFLQAIATMCPSPWGDFLDPAHATEGHLARQRAYLAPISGSLLDCFDMTLELPPLTKEELTGRPRGESSEQIRKRVEMARERQARQVSPSRGRSARLTAEEVRKVCRLTPDAHTLLRSAIDQLRLTGRGYDSVLKLARTIADLDGKDDVGVPHIAEAIQYRSLDHRLWGSR